MVKFLKVSITKLPIGTAVEHKEPALQGEIITKVTDTTTAGDYRIIVLESDEAQCKANLAIMGVEELSEAEAVKLAAKYQPKRTVTQIPPFAKQKEKVAVPVFDLKKFLKAKIGPAKK